MNAFAVLLYGPVLLWLGLGLGLLITYRRGDGRLLLRLSSAFVALWAVIATTGLLWVITHGGWGALPRLAASPDLLFRTEGAPLWAAGTAGALGILAIAFGFNQLLGRGLLAILRPAPMAWPSGLPRPATRTRLGRYPSETADAFSFTLVARDPAATFGLARREVILVSDGLLARLAPEEQAAVIAHELGHLQALDSRYLTFLRTLARLVRWDPIFAFFAATLTRREELRADQVAVELTGRPEALASAIRKTAVLPTRTRVGRSGDGSSSARSRATRTILAERLRRLDELSGAASEGG